MPYDECQAAKAIAKLQAENRALRAQLAEVVSRADQLADENSQLKKRLEELEREAARQAAPFRRRKRKKVDPSKKKRPGRKPGHAGARRNVPDHVDDNVELPLTCCPHCRGDVQNRNGLSMDFVEFLARRLPLAVQSG